MDESQHIYKTLDNPIRFLFWGMDECLIVAVPFFLGLCLHKFVLLFGGMILKHCFSKIKKKFPHGAFAHKLYWHLPTPALKHLSKIKNLPPSHQRELLL